VKTKKNWRGKWTLQATSLQVTGLHVLREAKKY